MADPPARGDRRTGLRGPAGRGQPARAGRRGGQRGAGPGRGLRGRRTDHPRRAGRRGRPGGGVAGPTGAPRGPGAARRRFQHRLRALLPGRAAGRGRRGAGQPRLHRGRTRAPGRRLRRGAGLRRYRARPPGWPGWEQACRSPTPRSCPRTSGRPPRSRPGRTRWRCSRTHRAPPAGPRGCR